MPQICLQFGALRGTERYFKYTQDKIQVLLGSANVLSQAYMAQFYKFLLFQPLKRLRCEAKAHTVWSGAPTN